MEARAVEETPRVSMVVYNYPYRRPMEARGVEECPQSMEARAVEETLLERFEKLLWKLPFRFV